MNCGFTVLTKKRNSWDSARARHREKARASRASAQLPGSSALAGRGGGLCADEGTLAAAPTANGPSHREYAINDAVATSISSSHRSHRSHRSACSSRAAARHAVSAADTRACATAWCHAAFRRSMERPDCSCLRRWCRSATRQACKPMATGPRAALQAGASLARSGPARRGKRRTPSERGRAAWRCATRDTRAHYQDCTRQARSSSGKGAPRGYPPKR